MIVFVKMIIYKHLGGGGGGIYEFLVVLLKNQ